MCISTNFISDFVPILARLDILKTKPTITPYINAVCILFKHTPY